VELPEEVSRVLRDSLRSLIDAYAASGDQYDPERDGHTVLIEEGDGDDVVRQAIGGRTLRDAVLEGVVLDRGVFLTVVLFNNEAGVTIAIPDAPWLDPIVRARLMSECEGG
jgi:hypothetical protein